MKQFLQKGQISLFVAITGALGMIGASIITAWTTTSSRVAGVEKPTTQGSAGYPHSYKALEETLARRVLEDLRRRLNEAKKLKESKTNKK